MKKLLRFVLLFSIFSSLLVGGTSIEAQEDDIEVMFQTSFVYNSLSDNFSNGEEEGYHEWETYLENLTTNTIDFDVSLSSDNVSSYSMSPEPVEDPTGYFSWNFPGIIGSNHTDNTTITISREGVNFTPGFSIGRTIDQPTFTGVGHQILNVHLEQDGEVEQFHINIDLPWQPSLLESVVFDTTYLLPDESEENIIEYAEDNQHLNIIIPNPESDPDGVWDYEVKIDLEVLPGKKVEYMPHVVVENKTFFDPTASTGSLLSYDFPYLGEWTWEAESGSYSWSATAYERRVVALAGFARPTNIVEVDFIDNNNYFVSGDDFMNGEVELVGSHEWATNIINIDDLYNFPIIDLTVDLNSDLALITYHWYLGDVPEASPPPPPPSPQEVCRAVQNGSSITTPGFDISRSIDPPILNDDGDQDLNIVIVPRETTPLITIMVRVSDDDVLVPEITSLEIISSPPPVPPTYILAPNGKTINISIPDPEVNATYEFNVEIHIDLKDGVQSAVHVPAVNVAQVPEPTYDDYYGSEVSHDVPVLGTWHLQAFGQYSWQWTDIIRKSVIMSGYSGEMKGSVTGSGWLTSPPGAYNPNPNLTGNATFDFDVKYQKGGSTPKGTFTFNLPDGFVFTSNFTRWLTVDSNNIELMGEGTIDSTGAYGFRLMAVDGYRNDALRVKIWDKTTGIMLYDNLMGCPDIYPEGGGAIGGGNIQIHHLQTTEYYTRPLPRPDAFQKGMNFGHHKPFDSQVYGLYTPPGTDQSLENLAATGANWIALIVSGGQETIDSTDIFYNSVATATDEELSRVIDLAHALGMRVMLKSSLKLFQDPTHGPPDIRITFETEEQWQEWFASYRDFIIHYATLAKNAHADMFCIGDELRGTVHRETEWRSIAQEIRQFYKGPIIYEATVNADEGLSEDKLIDWWDAVDYIGLLGYFPLTENNYEPTVEELKEAWSGYLSRLEILSDEFQRPIIISEIGYQSKDGTNQRPAGYQEDGPLDLEEQADCYEAALEVLIGQPWLAGIYWFHWSANPNAGGPNDKSYTPQGKPAEEILKSYYLSQ